MRQILSEGFAALGLPVTDTALAGFETYYHLLDERGSVMNLTAIREKEDVARLHFLDCAALLTLHDCAGKRVIDVGTGAGFPGLPMKLLEPTIALTLLDSLDKRVRFLQEVCGALALSDVTCLHARAEEQPQLRETFDLAVSRAVARLDVLCELCLPFVKVGGAFLAMKGRGAAEELEEAERAIAVLGGGKAELLPYAIPGTDTEHCVVRIEKVKPTPAKYPRRWAKIKSERIK
ncbi:MAG: 16S rRNA (guanine(527)-N(7))-methyltransferase RsmG [Oscillospiraceae bacterium]|nr:16S rRNA (guanine(527)-N(7))-methyltransferase RsmG [Oscillospiraceae bacterium]